MAVAGKLDLPPLRPFDPVSDPTSLSQRWKSWKRRFEIYVAAQKIEDDKQKRAVLLYQVGEATQEIFYTLPDTGDEYATAMTKLDSYFTPKKSVDYEIFQFRNTMQQPGETTDQFATRLRKLAATCEFTDVDKELKSTIIQNCLSKRLRRVALRDDLSLDNLPAKARSQEASEAQAKGIEETHPTLEKVNLVNQKRKQSPRTKGEGQTPCRSCGLPWPHKDGPCPAKGQKCKKCGKPNHFARMCFSKQVKPQGNYQGQS